MKAYVTYTKGFSGFGVVKAQTSSKARYLNLLTAHDAGYFDVGFPDIRVLRAVQYDRYEIPNGRCIGNEYIESYKAEQPISLQDESIYTQANIQVT